METVTAKDRQTLFDIALKVYGRAELAYDLAEENGLPLDEPPGAGAVIRVPGVAVGTDMAVVDAYELNSIEPATAATVDEIAALAPEGISYWYIVKGAPVFVVWSGTD